MNEEDVLDQMLACSACTDIGHYKSYSAGLTKRQKIDRMYELLPTIDYAKDMVVNYIFADGLVTNSVNTDSILENFLKNKNLSGVSNFSNLREAIGWAIVDGECGIRVFDDNLYLFRSGTFAVVYDKFEGITKVEGFIVRNDGGEISDVFSEYYDYLDYAGDDVTVLSTDEFIYLRNDVSFLHGQSPLLTDQLRLELLIETYQHLIDDLKYDGPGRLVLRPKDGFVAGDENEISTGAVLDVLDNTERRRLEKVKAEAERVAKEIKNSSSDSVIVLSNGFKDNIEHLERVTKSTEFLEWLDNEGMIISECIGVEGRLLGYGHQAGNVSMTKVIDNAMRNNIIPMREAYAVQFSDWLSKIVGVEQILFGEHVFEDAEEINETRGKVVDMMQKLYSIGETELVNDFSNMLKQNLYDENQILKQLSVEKKREVGVISKIRRLLGGN